VSIGNAFALIRAAEEHNAECARCAIVMPVPPAPAVDAVYTDGVHMAAVDVELLHATARRAGLRREWFQEGGTQFRGRGPIVSRDHYDMTTTRTYHRARSAGVAFVPWRDFARLFPARDRVGIGANAPGSA
jgi:hypothetical protein